MLTQTKVELMLAKMARHVREFRPSVENLTDIGFM
jgi:hypothetical protein